MLFVGIDLAWSDKNDTGIAIIDGNEKTGKVKYAGIVNSDADIIKFVNDNVGRENALIAIDAPLIVPNEKGRRLAEVIVGDLFRKYDAGAHPANRSRMGSWSNGKIRGEETVKKLSELGFLHDPYIKKFEKSRKMFEVYPHPSMVVLFNLDKILRYKAKPNRSSAFRIGEFKKYEKLLKGLSRANPSLKIGHNVIGKKLEKLRLTDLKKHEDTLDAVFCAYIAYYYWVNHDECAVLGDMKRGYIMTPIFDFMKGEQKHL